jgi:hypothetical protein
VHAAPANQRLLSPLFIFVLLVLLAYLVAEQSKKYERPPVTCVEAFFAHFTFPASVRTAARDEE